MEKFIEKHLLEDNCDAIDRVVMAIRKIAPEIVVIEQ
jgi:hypothetical protein